MKRTKSDWRNRVSPETLSQLMMVKLNGPDMDHFYPEPAVIEGGKPVLDLVELHIIDNNLNQRPLRVRKTVKSD